MSSTLTETNVAIFIAERGTEQAEFTDPKAAIENAGATVDVLSFEANEVRAVNNDLDYGDTFEADRAFEEAAAEEYDAVVIPGGTVGADDLRRDDDAVALIEAFDEEGKPIGAICHAPWTLVEAGVVEGRTLTSYPSLQTDIRNAGGEWVDQEVVVSEGVVTSRTPEDLEAFCDRLIETIENQ